MECRSRTFGDGLGRSKERCTVFNGFHPDATDWRIDVLHAIACYVLCQDGGFKASTTPNEIYLSIFIFNAIVFSSAKTYLCVLLLCNDARANDATWVLFVVTGANLI